MATTYPTIERTKAVKAVITKVVSKYQVTVPPEIRAIYDLREGDLIEWNFNPETAQLVLCPKRAHLITPQLEREILEAKKDRERQKLSKRALVSV